MAYPHLQKTVDALSESWFVGPAAGSAYRKRLLAAFNARYDKPDIDHALSLGDYSWYKHTASNKQQRLALRAVLLSKILTNPGQSAQAMNESYRSRYEPLPADQLKSTFVALLSETTQLAEKFTAIRNLKIVYGTSNPNATLTPGDVQALSHLALRSAPQVRVARNVTVSRFGGVKAEMQFLTIFNSKVDPAPPCRVIRFVRAAQVYRDTRHVSSQADAYKMVAVTETVDECTTPGYVHYGSVARSAAADSGSEVYFRGALMQRFQAAQWAFDGPAKEFEPHLGLKNLDKPGKDYTETPYAIAADFLIVLYDEDAKLVLEVGHNEASLAVWGGGRHSFTRTAGMV